MREPAAGGERRREVMTQHTAIPALAEAQGPVQPRSAHREKSAGEGLRRFTVKRENSKDLPIRNMRLAVRLGWRKLKCQMFPQFALAEKRKTACLLIRHNKPGAPMVSRGLQSTERLPELGNTFHGKHYCT